MKAIMISDHAQWCALMMNGDKTVEVRKGTALYKATQKLIDEYGYAEFYVYNTRDERYRLDKELNGKYFVWDTKSKDYPFDKTRNRHYFFGKVVFKFRCYKVEEIKLNKGACGWFYETTTLCEKDLLKNSCLSLEDLRDYLDIIFGDYEVDSEKGCAIHISDLEIFDKPKELNEFYKVGHYEDLDDYFTDEKQINGKWCIPLKKAPQSMCYIEVKEEQ